MPRFSSLCILPEKLFRFYKEVEYAKEFAKGYVRLNRLENYRTIEDDALKDPDEGEGRLRIPGEVPRIWISRSDRKMVDQDYVDDYFKSTIAWLNPIYILSTCLPTICLDYAKDKFGKEIVTIHNTALFVRNLEEALKKYSFGEVKPIWLHALPVQYDKDAIAEKPSLSEESRLPYNQKPGKYQDEQEYRFAVALSEFPRPDLPLPEFLDLKLADSLQFCSHRSCEE